MIKLLKYDYIYLWKTYKFLIFPAIAVIFAFASPLTAKYINELLTLLTSTATGDPLIVLPDPTIQDSYAQYASNLYEIFLIVGIFVSVSIFMSDKNKGLLPLILSKPINRTKYLLSKVSSLSVVILVSLLAGGIIFSYSTWVLFDSVDVLLVLWMSLLFFVYVVFVFASAMFFSQYTKNYATASILTFIVYIVFSIFGGFEKGVLEYLPGRLTVRITELIFEIGEASTLIWTIIVTIVISVVLFYFSLRKFNKYDL
jgi:ABC-2 type transport system permease protein